MQDRSLQQLNPQPNVFPSLAGPSWSSAASRPQAFQQTPSRNRHGILIGHTVAFADGAQHPSTPQIPTAIATNNGVPASPSRCIISQKSPSTPAHISNHSRTSIASAIQSPAPQASPSASLVAGTSALQDKSYVFTVSGTADTPASVDMNTVPQQIDAKSIWRNRNLDELEFKPREKKTESLPSKENAVVAETEKDNTRQPRENVNLLDEDVYFNGEYHSMSFVTRNQTGGKYISSQYMAIYG